MISSFVLTRLIFILKLSNLLLCYFCVACRRRVIQVFARGARVLDGSYMTQDLSIGSPSSESSESSTVLSVSIADPYVLLRMSDRSIQLLVGGMMHTLLAVMSFCQFLGLGHGVTLFHIDDALFIYNFNSMVLLFYRLLS